MVIKASTGFTKYFVNTVSPNLFSCGNILSAIQTTMLCLLDFALRKIVPRHAPMKGSQYLTTIISGLYFFNSFPIFIQLRGSMELMHTFILRFAGAGSDEYWVVPGNKNCGY